MSSKQEEPKPKYSEEVVIAFRKKQLSEGYDKLLEKYYISRFSPEFFIENLAKSNIEKDSFRTIQVNKNIIEFKEFCLNDVKEVMNSGDFDLISDKLGSDETEGPVKFEAPFIKKLNLFRDEIAAATAGTAGKKVTELYTNFISEIQKLVKRYAEGKNKYQRGKAISNAKEGPDVSNSLVQVNLHGHTFYVGLDDFIEWKKTGIAPSRRMHNLSESIKREIRQNKRRLLSENEAVDIQNKKLYKEEEPKEVIVEDFGDEDKSKEQKAINKQFVSDAIKSNYKKYLITKSLLEQEYSEAKALQVKLNSEKKELAKSERPGSQALVEATRKYLSAKSKVKELEEKLEEVYRKLSEMHSKFPHLIKD